MGYLSDEAGHLSMPKVAVEDSLLKDDRWMDDEGLSIGTPGDDLAMTGVLNSWRCTCRMAYNLVMNPALLLPIIF